MSTTTTITPGLTLTDADAPADAHLDLQVSTDGSLRLEAWNYSPTGGSATTIDLTPADVTRLLEYLTAHTF